MQPLKPIHLSATARAVCSDPSQDAWEVQVKDLHGTWCTVSDTSDMTAADAESLAASVRASGHQRGKRQ